MSRGNEITDLLRAWQGGDEQALADLTESVYAELHRLARGAFRGESAGHTLQPTALVNEAFVRLVGAEIDWQDRAHFFALCARMMRRILVNHAERRNAVKRGDGVRSVTLSDELAGTDEPDPRLEELDEALSALETVDPPKAELIELKIFGGLTFEEMTAVTGLSTSTLDRQLRFAKTWLKQYLAG